MKIAILLARSGSKRIKNKNIKNLYGKPIIFHTLEKVFKFKLFNRVIISSNSDKILNMCKKNFRVHLHKRKFKYSNDFASTTEAIRSCISDLELPSKDDVCCIYPCSPFLNKRDIVGSYRKMLKYKKKHFSIPVVAYQHPIQRAFYLKEEKLISINKKLMNSRGQDFIDSFHDVGQFYWGNVSTWLKNKGTPLSNAVGVKVKGLEYIDVNTMEDWKKIQQIYRILK